MLPRRSFGRQQTRLRAGCRNQLDGSAIEAGEDRSAQPTALEGDDAVCEIPARLEHREPCIDGWPIRPDARAIDQAPDRRYSSIARSADPASISCLHPI